MDKPCQRVAIELLREDRDERAKRVIAGPLRVVVQGPMQIKMQGDELVGTETLATRVKGRKCLHVY